MSTQFLKKLVAKNAVTAELEGRVEFVHADAGKGQTPLLVGCLLYTSDAADE